MIDGGWVCGEDVMERDGLAGVVGLFYMYRNSMKDLK